MNRYKWFEQRRQEFISTHSGKLANTRAFIEYCKSKMEPQTWEKYKRILDQKCAGLPHHKNRDYDPIKAKKLRRKWALARYEFMYGPLKCKNCGSTHGPLFDSIRRKTAIRILVRHDYCSEHCSKSSAEARAKRESTTIERYGVRNVTYIPEVMEKIKRYNRDPNNIKKKQEKTNRTIIEKYGSLETYYNMLAKKRLPTIQKRYGGNAATCDPEVRKKVRQTVLKRWGTTNVSKCPEIQERIVQGLKKHFTGRICGKYYHNLQGYEPKFIKWAVQHTKLSIDEIQNNCIFAKYTYKGKEHTYYPDLVVPKKRIVIEVKSEATSGVYATTEYYDYNKNRAKAKAIVELGFHYAFALYSEHKKDWFIWKGKLPKRREFLSAYENWILK